MSDTTDLFGRELPKDRYERLKTVVRDYEAAIYRDLPPNTPAIRAKMATESTLLVVMQALGIDRIEILSGEYAGMECPHV